MKYTLFLTQRCNLACDYCYVGKNADRMSPELARRIIDFAYQNTPSSEDIEINFFGGEPLLELPLMRQITEDVEADARFDPQRVKLALATNGTLLTSDMLRFFKQHYIGITISCDGPQPIHDRFRHYPDGSGTSSRVESSIGTAISIIGGVAVNAVYGPETLSLLGPIVDYFSSLGVRQIYLNPNFFARWSELDLKHIPSYYRAVADRYMNFYRRGDPHFISLLDHKITVMLRGGYQTREKCRMGRGEFAFTPSGKVYPCERLAASDPETHCIGKVHELVEIGPLRDQFATGPPINTPCLSCSIREYCVNWCGCSNYFMTGFYNRVNPFLCASEHASLQLATEIFQTLEAELGPTFVRHFGDGLRSHKQWIPKSPLPSKPAHPTIRPGISIEPQVE